MSIDSNNYNEFLSAVNAIDYKEISLFTTPLGNRVQTEVSEQLLKKTNSDSAYALYMSEVNEAISDIAQSFDDIQMTIRLIKFAHPAIKSFKMTRVDRGDYLKYHFENFFFRIPKIKDQVLQLLNVVYQMGLMRANGLEKKVRKHSSVVDNKLSYFIDYLDEVFEKIKPQRDNIAHRSDLKDTWLTMLLPVIKI